MTTTYDPTHPRYFDEADVRAELTRVYDVCQGCRRCVDHCASFPTLFEMIDQHDDRDAGLLTPAQQDLVVDRCFQCKRCALDCPYTPELHEWDLDFPRLMLRAGAMQHANGLEPVRRRAATRVIARTDLVGTLATAASAVANSIVSAKPGSVRRRLAARVTGVSAFRLLPTFAAQRFSTWFENRPTISLTNRHGRVTVFPTCVVEYQAPDIGKDLVKVYERNGIECTTTGARCCGAPWLHAGNVKEFTRIAGKNVEALAAEIRSGTDIVVAQPTCSYVIKRDYPVYAPGPDAQLVAERTHDAAEYLMAVHRADDSVLDTNFTGDIAETITYHAPCHLRAQLAGFESRDLMRLTGATVHLVQQCAGLDGMWGLRAGNEDISVPIAKRLGAEIDAAGGDIVAGDCHLANTVIVEQTGRRPRHPLQVMARAYGIATEP
jgi:Fe-S oxidoreductase